MNIRIELESYHVNAARAKKKVMNDRGFWTFAATQWHRLYKPYVPFYTGKLANGVRYEPKCIEHVVPYAHYQYTGEVYGPNYPITRSGRVVGYYSPPRKHPTGRALQYPHNPMASKEWDKKAEATQKPKLISSLQRYINSGRLNLNG